MSRELNEFGRSTISDVPAQFLMPTVSALPQLVREVFGKLEEKNRSLPKEDRLLSPDEISQLHGLFGVVLDRALDLVERNKVKLYISTSQICQLLEVVGGNGVAYKFYPNINYCPCKAFKNTVLLLRTEYTCKHVLAAKLARILDRCTVETITDDNFNFLVTSVLHQLNVCDELADEP